jgi:hypothetical protein
MALVPSMISCAAAASASLVFFTGVCEITAYPFRTTSGWILTLLWERQ